MSSMAGTWTGEPKERNTAAKVRGSARSRNSGDTRQNWQCHHQRVACLPSRFHARLSARRQALVQYRPSAANFPPLTGLRSQSQPECLNELADILEWVVMYNNLFITGNINMHLSQWYQWCSLNFNQLLTIHNLLQHVSVTTHNQLHTIDFIWSRLSSCGLLICVNFQILHRLWVH